MMPSSSPPEAESAACAWLNPSGFGRFRNNQHRRCAGSVILILGPVLKMPDIQMASDQHQFAGGIALFIEENTRQRL
jgi:hypothetical protein